MRVTVLPIALASAFMLVSLSAEAGIIFELGNNPQPDEQNILLNDGTTGTTVVGVTNVTNQIVNFSSTTDILGEPVDGQARITSISRDGRIENITMSADGFLPFVDAILDPLTGTGDATVTVQAYEPDGTTGTFTFTFALGNGQNFITIVAVDGEMIRSITLDAAGGFTSLNGPRISGLTAATAAVPEPASLTLLSIGLTGWVGRRRLAAKRAASRSR